MQLLAFHAAISSNYTQTANCQNRHSSAPNTIHRYKLGFILRKLTNLSDQIVALCKFCHFHILVNLVAAIVTSIDLRTVSTKTVSIFTPNLLYCNLRTLSPKTFKQIGCKILSRHFHSSQLVKTNCSLLSWLFTRSSLQLQQPTPISSLFHFLGAAFAQQLPDFFIIHSCKNQHPSSFLINFPIRSINFLIVSYDSYLTSHCSLIIFSSQLYTI